MYKIFNEKFESIVVIIVTSIIILVGLLVENTTYRLIIPFAIIGCFLVLIAFKKKKKEMNGLKQSNIPQIQQAKINKYVYVSLLLSFLGLFFYGFPCLFGIYFGYKACKIINKETSYTKKLKFLTYMGLILNVLTILIVVLLYIVIGIPISNK
jgi:mannose/fructose/N-acetylgalactosamine-specific phosphotransferase system component IIC